MVQSLSNLQVHNEILPATARVTCNNRTRLPDLLWILRFNTRYIRASLVYRTIQKGHTYYSTSKHRDLIHITRPQMKINIVKKQYRVTNVYFTFSQPSQLKKRAQIAAGKQKSQIFLFKNKMFTIFGFSRLRLMETSSLLQRTPFWREQMYQGCKDTSSQFLR